MRANQSYHCFIAMLNYTAYLNLAKRDAIMHSCWVALFIVLMTVVATPSAQTLLTTPSAPTGLMVKQQAGIRLVTSNSITLTWTAPINDGGSAIKAYRIDRAQGNGRVADKFKPLKILTTLAGDSINADHDNSEALRGGTKYSYWTHVANPVGTGAHSNVIMEPITASDSLVADHQIEQADLAGVAINAAALNPIEAEISTAIEYIDTSLNPNTAYRYRVTAINDAGRGVFVELAVTTLPAVTLDAPMLTGVVADDNACADNFACTNKTGGSANNDGSAITGYQIERAQGVEAR